MIGVTVAFLSARGFDPCPKPVLRRLLPPLAFMVVVMTIGAGALLWQQYRQRLEEDLAGFASDVKRQIRISLEQQALGLAAALQPITADAGVKQALRLGDTERLLSDWRPVFEKFKRENHLTHFYFFDITRVCLLRVHKPEKHGDLIDRFTMLKAERTGKISSGIELGPLGTFTLRVVQPVFDGGALVGYVELGKEIEDVLQALHERADIELSIVIRKEYLNRYGWEDGMRMLGRDADWDRLSDRVLIYNSQGRLSDPSLFPTKEDLSLSSRIWGKSGREISYGGKSWRMSATPLQDASGEQVGDLVVMRDLTIEQAAFADTVMIGGAAGAVLLALMLGFVYVLLRRTDEGIRAQQAEMRQREEHISSTLRSIGDGVISCDPDGKVVNLNTVAETLTGWETGDAKGRPIAEIFRILNAETRQEAEIPVYRALRENRIIGLADHTVLLARDGTELKIADTCAPIHDESGIAIGAVLIFRDVTEEYRRGEQLRVSEEKHRLLFEHAVSAIAIHEILLNRSGRPVDYVFLSANQAFETHTGMRVADVIGRRVTKILPGIEKTPFLEIYGKVVLTGESVTFEQYCQPLGRHYFINAYRLGTNRFATVFADITARKQAEEQTERLLRILQHPSETIQEFLDYTLEQTIQLTGSKMGYIYHFREDRKEFVLNTWSREVMPECAIADPQTCYDLEKTGIWGEAVRQRQPIIVNDFPADHPLKKGLPEGHVRLLKFMTVPIFEGKDIVGVVGLANKEHDYDATDIRQVSLLMEAVWKVTERKQAEEALRESETRLHAITDSAQEAILMMDPLGAISYWNPAAEAVLGYRAEEAMGKDLHRLLAPERYQEAYRSAWPEFKRTGHGKAVGKTLELAARRRDGREIAIALSLSGVSLKGQWHAVGILRDITARKRAEEELLETNRQLESATARSNEMAVQAEMANIAKGEFLANMSHEIRTPMNGVIGMTGLLLDTELTDEQRRYAEMVRSSSESLLCLINNILDFSKIEAKKLDLEHLDFDLLGLLDDLAATMAIRSHEKGIELLCSVDPSSPTRLRGDPGRLRQILTNLTGNAIKFTHNGEVAIRVSLMEEGEKDVLLRFSVQDTGIGIPKDKLGLLFKKFSQVDASTTRRYGGTGLGLAIAKQMAELMGGKIGVESKKGKGSVFWFTARFLKQPVGQVEHYPPKDLRDVRVLVVDDNATSREILTRYLSLWSMRSSEAQDGPEAIQALYRALDEKDPFRIVLIDMQMPGMGGKTLGRIIKADNRLADTRLIMLASLGMRSDTGQFAEIGFVANAAKPIRQKELKDLLSVALAEQGGTDTMQRPTLAGNRGWENLNLLAGRKGRILLVEDNITNQQVAIVLLKKLGLRADAVADGLEALEALRSIPYDLVLMDVQMPEMDGLTATKAIRNPRSAGSPVINHRIPIIAMTAHAMEDDWKQCLEAGMNDYLSKPVSPQALAEVLDKWLPKENGEEERSTHEFRRAKPVSEYLSSSVTFDKVGLLTRLMDDEGLARKVADGFLEDIPRQIEALKGYLEMGEAPQAERQAHSIKGASASMGGERLREVAFEMEKAAGVGDLVAAGELMTELEAQFDALKWEIGNWEIGKGVPIS
jgi:two-component system, sensor histidine kinase and response regulator